jgi:hypothetical protein
LNLFLKQNLMIYFEIEQKNLLLNRDFNKSFFTQLNN